MNIFFVLLLFAVLIAFVVGLIKPRWVRMSSRKRVAMIFGGMIIVLLILIGTTAPHVPVTAKSASVDATTSPATIATTSVAMEADDDITSAADETVAQAALVKASSTSVPATPPSKKAGPASLYPNPSLTPGAVLSTNAATICAKGYASTVRNVSTATKKQVYAEYGASYPQAVVGTYEVDHFIPLEIGGSNDIKNLWLEPASPTPGFHQKDQFENLEHDQICSGKISVQEAQNRMVSDWYYYYEIEIAGVTPGTSAPVTQTAPAAQPQPAATPTPATSATAAYYTSSYHSSKYYYPASCSAWKSLSPQYLVSFDSLSALLAQYPSQTLSPQCQ